MENQDSLPPSALPSVTPESGAELTELGKLYFASLVSWIFGKPLNLKIRGDAKNLQALSNAVIASKRFQEALKDPNSSVEEILKAINLKKNMADEFEQICGLSFPL